MAADTTTAPGASTISDDSGKLKLYSEPAGEIEQPHAFWWSTALRVPTSDGTLWFKATQPDGAFEVRLTPLLASEWPDRTVEVVAADPQRGWRAADRTEQLRAAPPGYDPPRPRTAGIW